jgi:hypothetical protein
MVIGEWSVDELAVPSRKITRCARSGLPVCYGRCAGGTTDCRLRGVCLTKARPGSGAFFLLIRSAARPHPSTCNSWQPQPLAGLAERVTTGRALSRYKTITPPRPNDGRPSPKRSSLMPDPRSATSASLSSGRPKTRFRFDQSRFC